MASGAADPSCGGGSGAASGDGGSGDRGNTDIGLWRAPPRPEWWTQMREHTIAKGTTTRLPLHTTERNVLNAYFLAPSFNALRVLSISIDGLRGGTREVMWRATLQGFWTWFCQL